MSGIFNLKVYEADNTFLKGEAELVVIPTIDGEFGVMAKHEKSKSFMLFNKDKVELFSDRKMVVHVDGEYGGESKHVKFEVLPERLKVII